MSGIGWVWLALGLAILIDWLDFPLWGRKKVTEVKSFKEDIDTLIELINADDMYDRYEWYYTREDDDEQESNTR
jgi:hypothetical protein